MLSRAARRAGTMAPTTPTTTASTRNTTSWPNGTLNPTPRSLSAKVVSQANSDADRGAEHAADERGDDALVADDHAPHLAGGRADGAQHPELARALVDRQEQAVGDPEHRDHDAHGQQRVEQVDDLVDLARRSSRGTRCRSAPWRSGTACEACATRCLAAPTSRPSSSRTKYAIGSRERRERAELGEVDHRRPGGSAGRGTRAIAAHVAVRPVGRADPEALADADAVLLGELLLDRCAAPRPEALRARRRCRGASWKR